MPVQHDPALVPVAAAAHVAPSADAHSVIGALALIASLRAIWIVPCRLLAVAVSRLPSDASRNDGTASIASTAMMKIVNISSTSVTPRCRVLAEPGGGRVDPPAAVATLRHFSMYQ